MKKNHQLKSKRNVFVCLGITLTLLAGFSACDFEPSKIGRAIGGSLAEGEDVGNEFIENAGSAGESSGDYKQSGDLALPLLTKQEIRSMLDRTDAKNLPANTDIMEVKPNFDPPNNPGKVKQEALQLALDRLNALRRISGLPAVVMTEAYNQNAQAGAFLMSATGRIDHYGFTKPENMEQELFNQGASAAETSNVYSINNLIAGIDGFNRDPGNPTVGHRCWQMAPGQQAVGFGFIPAGFGGQKAAFCERVTYTEAPADQKPAPFDWDFVSYPSSGYFPLLGSLFGSPAIWSVNLNPNKYTVDKDAVTIRLTRLNDGKTWDFPWTYAYMGKAHCVFRIQEAHTYQDGEQYKIQIFGLKDNEGNSVDFAFKTEFFTP